MRKRIVVLSVSVLLFFAVILVGVLTVFKVDDVALYYNDSTETGLIYRDEMKEKLDEYCLKKNILFLREPKIIALFSDTKYVNTVSVRKIYPNKIVVYAKEETEVFAVNFGGEYVMFDEMGNILSTAKENKNRADGHTNILLEGFSFDGEKWLDYQETELAFRAYQILNEELEGARSNLKSISLLKPTSSSKDDFLEIQTQEGVVMQMSAPASKMREKLLKLVSSYRSLSTEEKLFGVIHAFEREGSEEILSEYTSRYGDVKQIS